MNTPNRAAAADLMHLEQWTGDGMSVLFSELVTVTADSADLPSHAPLAELLQRIRGGMGVDAVFVSQSVEGKPLVRPALEQDGGGVDCGCDPLEQAHAQRVLEARPLPPPPIDPAASREERRLALLARQQPPCQFHVPVIDEQGSEYGTLSCLCRSDAAGQQERSLALLQLLARRLASALAVLHRDDGQLPAVTSRQPFAAAAPLSRMAAL